MSEFDQSDGVMTDSDISHTSTDTEDGSNDSCDDLDVSNVNIDLFEDGDIGDISVVDSSREGSTSEGNTVETVKGPSWDNKKLFPPGAKCKSRVWLFGGFVKDSAGKLVTEETICGICGKRQKYRNTPTNLHQHLQSNHSFQYDTAIVENVDESKKDGTIDEYFKKVSLRSYAPNHPKQKALLSTLSEWIVKSNRALAEVEDEKLVEAFAIADPKLNVPSRKAVRREIVKLYNKKRHEFDEEISEKEYFAGNNDAGSSSNSKSFIAMNVSYVTKDFHLKTKILDILEMPENKNAANYRRKVDGTEENHGIAGKVFVYTTDNENTMKAAFGKEERNGCFAHIESKASKKALDSQQALKKLRLKLRKIAKKANKSSKFKYALINQQKTRSLRLKTLKQEVKTRFTATHTMIRSFLNDPSEGTDEPIDVNKVKENIDAINCAMIDAKFSKKDLEKLEIKQDDLKKMIKLTPILDALEEGITLLGAEKYATGSSVLPFEKKFGELLESDEDDPLYLAKFKSDLLKEMKTRCDDNLNRKVLAKASFFDKRFEKIEKFLDESESEDVINDIRSELYDLERSLEIVNSEERNNNEEEPAKKKKRVLGARFFDSDDEDDITAGEELERYRKEPRLKADGCPFQWWRNRCKEYPLMARLARKYLAVSGTSTPSERVISRLGLVLTKRRLTLKGDFFSKIMFLSDIV